MEEDWPRRRILVVGDVMLDKYVWGEVERISPEAPVPVVRAMNRSEQPGGAGNVAMNLAALGAQVMLAGFTGDDPDGETLRRQLASAGIEAHLVAVADFPTVSKLRILGGNQQMLRLDVERSGMGEDVAAQRLLGAVLPRVPGCDAVVLSDYAKGVLAARVCQEIIRVARDASVPVLVDPKGVDFGKYRGATTISPNAGELAAAVGANRHDVEGLLRGARALVGACGLEYLVVTLGDKGIAVVREEGQTIAPAVARQVFDVSGAGDTVLSVLALCVASAVPIEVAIRVANAAAGVVVSKVGTVPVQKWELLAAVSDAQPRASGKILNRAELLARIAAWRKAGETVALTNGCFDLLHVGHTYLLQQARREADRLVVALNDDDSVKRVKGAGRPIVKQAQRAQVLAALSAVDAVTIFSEDTPLALIEAMRPDVLVKGGDYTEATVVGAELMPAWGGRVKIVPLIEGFSTSELIARSRR